MTTNVATHTLPFQLGEPQIFRALTLIPIFPLEPPRLEYIGLDEAVARGLTISEVGAEGIVELLAVTNPLGDAVLLYEGEELVGAKQNRILERTTLVGAGSTLKIPAKCVERGRWSHRSDHFQPAPRAAYPSARRASKVSQQAVWADVSAKSVRLAAHSETEAAEAMYFSRAASLDEYAQALPRADGQSGALVGTGGQLACLDYVSRSDVFAGLYLKLLRGYALDALEAAERKLSATAVGRFLGELELTEGEAFDGYATGTRLVVDGETIALTALPSNA
jgi:hypothetical protein